MCQCLTFLTLFGVSSHCFATRKVHSHGHTFGDQHIWASEKRISGTSSTWNHTQTSLAPLPCMFVPRLLVQVRRRGAGEMWSSWRWTRDSSLMLNWWRCKQWSMAPTALIRPKSSGTRRRMATATGMMMTSTLKSHCMIGIDHWSGQAQAVLQDLSGRLWSESGEEELSNCRSFVPLEVR